MISIRVRVRARWSLPLPLLLYLTMAGGGGHAQTDLSGSQGPIEITADTLEVRQKQRVATFTGEVDAVQGDIVLSADQLRVYYRGDAEAGQTTGSSTSIRRIEAFGNVFLSSPEETAQGDAGVYVVDSRKVTLEGAVVLTKGQNVIRGDRLEYNLKTGRSQVFAASEGGQERPPGERVRAVFVPNDEDDEGDGVPVRAAAGSEPEQVANRRASDAPAAGGASTAGSQEGTTAVVDEASSSTATWPPLPPQRKPSPDG